MIKKCLLPLIKGIDYFFIFGVYAYKLLISPFKPKVCKFLPTCSTYMILCIKEFHFVKGIKLGLNRLLRCKPSAKGGYDFIPYNIKGDLKWVI